MFDNHTNNYNHIEGNNNFINNITNNIINNNNRIQPVLETKETNETTLVKKELIKLFFSVITPIITFIVKLILESFVNSKNMAISFLQLIFQFAIVLVPIYSFLAIIIIATHLWQIKKQLKGNPIILKSIFDFLLSVLPSNSNFSPREIAGKVYVSKNDKIYRIVGCTCPMCKVGTIGKMSFKKYDKKLYLQCNQNHNHIIEFDHKNFNF